MHCYRTKTIVYSACILVAIYTTAKWLLHDVAGYANSTTVSTMSPALYLRSSPQAKDTEYSNKIDQWRPDNVLLTVLLPQPAPLEPDDPEQISSQQRQERNEKAQSCGFVDKKRLVHASYVGCIQSLISNPLQELCTSAC